MTDKNTTINLNVPKSSVSKTAFALVTVAIFILIIVIFLYIKNLIDNQTSQVTSLTSLNTKEIQDIKDLKDKTDKLFTSIDAINTSITTLTTSVNDSNVAVNLRIDNLVKNMNDTNTDQSSLIDDARKNVSSVNDDLNLKIAVLKTGMVSVNDKIVNLQTQIDALVKKNKDNDALVIPSRVITIESDLSKIKSNMVTNANIITDLTTRLTIAEASIKSIFTKISDMVTNVILNSQLSVISTTLKSMFQPSIDANTRDIAGIKSNIGNINMQITDIKTSITTITDKIKYDLTNLINMTAIAFNKYITISETTVSITFNSSSTPISGLFKFTKVGNLVSCIWLNPILGDFLIPDYILSNQKAIPVGYIPMNNCFFIISCFNKGQISTGMMRVGTDGTISFTSNSVDRKFIGISAGVNANDGKSYLKIQGGVDINTVSWITK